MYLDIGANAQTVSAPPLPKKSQPQPTNSALQPAWAWLLTVRVDGATTVTDSDIVALMLTAGSSGTLTVSRSGNNVTAAGISGIARFIAEGLTLNSSDTATPDSSVTTLEKRLTYVDYNIITEETYTTVISQIDSDPPTMTVYNPGGTILTNHTAIQEYGSTRPTIFTSI